MEQQFELHNVFSKTAKIAAPYVESHPICVKHHGVEHIDEFAWLRASNWKEVLRNPLTLPEEIRVYLCRENEFCRRVLEDTESLQTELALEICNRLPEGDSYEWLRDGDFEYGILQDRKAHYPKIVRRRISANDHIVLIDIAHEAEGKAYFRSGFSRHDPTHRVMAWAVDEVGSERFMIRFRDMTTGKDLDDRIFDAAPFGAFSLDGRYFLYAGLDENNRKHCLYIHKVGDKDSQDMLLIKENDPRFSLSVRLTQSRNWFVLSSESHEVSEVYLLSASDPTVSPLMLMPRQTSARFYVDEGDGVLFARTDMQGASEYKIVSAPVAIALAGNWCELVSQKSGTTIIQHRVYKRHLVWLECKDGVVEVVVRRHADGRTSSFDFGGGFYSLDLSASYEFDTDIVRLVFSSMAQPPITFDGDMESGNLIPVKTQRLNEYFRSSDYRVLRIHATTSDGMQVPISILAHRRTLFDGTAPCLLYGYGAYGVSLPANFDSQRLSLVDRGFIYAIAHVRGGGEMGMEWHSAGRGPNKLRGILDFIAVAQHLVKKGYCAEGNIVCHGISAGGALVAAAVNLAPAIFSGLVAEAPFVDVLNTMLDESLPLTALEWKEWGNPLASKKEFELIANWSPYDNVVPQKYPPVLALAGLSDPRVTYWEAAKWTARIRARQTSSAPILLNVKWNAGHIGATDRLERISTVALIYAFVLKAAGYSD